MQIWLELPHVASGTMVFAGLALALTESSAVAIERPAKARVCLNPRILTSSLSTTHCHHVCQCCYLLIVEAFDHACRGVGERDFAVLVRSEEHTSELQSLMRISYAVFCLKKKNK